MNKNKFGFVAQDLEPIVPSAVEYDKNTDSYGVNYISIIPILVEALKEQQSIIEDLQIEIRSLKNSLDSKNKSGVIQGIENQDDFKPTLYQNTPNPFSAQTEIRFFLPESAKSATLYIYDMQGTQLKSIPVQQRGNGSVVIHGSELQAGMYLYALTADGQEVDTKRMMLTK